jgi:hypothetical protein
VASTTGANMPQANDAPPNLRVASGSKKEAFRGTSLPPRGPLSCAAPEPTPLHARHPTVGIRGAMRRQTAAPSTRAPHALRPPLPPLPNCPPQAAPCCVPHLSCAPTTPKLVHARSSRRQAARICNTTPDAHTIAQGRGCTAFSSGWHTLPCHAAAHARAQDYQPLPSPCAPMRASMQTCTISARPPTGSGIHVHQSHVPPSPPTIL